jgi:hypothetical protein
MRLLSIRPILLALTGVALMACDGTGPDPAGPPASLDIISGDLQTATAGTELPQPLVVEVTDDKGKPVEGQVVNFVIVTDGGSLFAGTALTNKDGRAQERWTLGTTARDTQKVEARAVDPATGQALVFATFRAVATPGAPASLVRVLGGTTTGAPGVALADSLAVRLTDQYGNGISSQTIAFAASGGGSVSPATRATDADGYARTSWTLGTNLGTPQTVSATFGTLAASPFTATMVAGGTLTRTGGVTQTGTAGAVLLDSLAVRFTTPTGAPIQGATIQWTGPGVLTPATSTTDANGYARTSWRLPTAAGTYQATANLAGATEMLAFTATAGAGAPTALAKVGGDAQTGDPGAALDSLAVRVTDANGNPVSGAAVTFAPVGGGSVSPATTTTGANGIARTRWTLGTHVGLAQTASASVSGVPQVTFTATSTGSGVLTRVSGNAQTDTIGAFLADSLVVRFSTAGGQPIQGATIQWSHSGPGGSVLPRISVTRADGTVRAQWKLASEPGTQEAAATVAGQTGRLVFTATARPVAPHSLTVNLAPLDALINTVRTVRVQVKDRYGNPTPGVTVQWAVVCGGPMSPASSQTDANGYATTQWTVNAFCAGGPTPGPRATATVAGVPSLLFGALVHVGSPASVRANPPEVTVAPGASFTLSYRLYDAAGVYIDPENGECHYSCYYGYAWTIRDPSVAQIAEIRDEDIPFPRVEAVGAGTTWAIVQGQAGLDSARIVVTSTAAARSRAPLRAPAPAGGSARTAPAVRPRGSND